MTEGYVGASKPLIGLLGIGALALLATACKPSSELGNADACKAYQGLPVGWGTDPHAGMQRIPAGRFQLGSERGYAEERPLQDTPIEAFWIDRTEVTNAQFAAFVNATGYVTEAEKDRPDAGSVVFQVDPQQALIPGSWWHLKKGADWRHPEGPGSHIDGRQHDPVVNVSFDDALAYAHWLGRTLPSEAQWEYAAKAGRSDVESDRALRDANGKPQANFWQGVFPLADRGEDGYAGRAPVGCYAANPYGLQDMVGNVWEWTTDPWHDQHLTTTLADQEAALPSRGQVGRRVIKGGSYLCSTDYCSRARASSRQPAEIDLPSEHLGFRTVTVDGG